MREQLGHELRLDLVEHDERDELPEASPRVARPEGAHTALLDDGVGGGAIALVLDALDVALHAGLDRVGRVREHAADRRAEEGGGEARAVLGLADGVGVHIPELLAHHRHHAEEGSGVDAFPRHHGERAAEEGRRPRLGHLDGCF
eukprot:scaffold88791_cov65-Phaeocystis_antarctica.AAC.7